MSGIVITRYENGKAAEAWVKFDFLGLYRQLGVIPTRGGAPPAVVGVASRITRSCDPMARKVDCSHEDARSGLRDYIRHRQIGRGETAESLRVL